jgi:hypothetical protein
VHGVPDASRWVHDQTVRMCVYKWGDSGQPRRTWGCLRGLYARKNVTRDDLRGCGKERLAPARVGGCPDAVEVPECQSELGLGFGTPPAGEQSLGVQQV